MVKHVEGSTVMINYEKCYRAAQKKKGSVGTRGSQRAMSNIMYLVNLISDITLNTTFQVSAWVSVPQFGGQVMQKHGSDSGLSGVFVFNCWLRNFQIRFLAFANQNSSNMRAKHRNHRPYIAATLAWVPL
ncbi:hypothetical protein VNO78_32907 [Psophocarpus tetragonolobus]|uniref:Uncharacterized protein n=1 Tax=Psophocarpus tetragonolobus TaxID=3891 RepID=A0AAN9NWZ9_PSOTE